MKKAILIGFAATLISFVNLSYANFTIHTSTNSCGVLTGEWAGVGNVKNWMVDCNYHGTGTMTGVDGAGNFMFDVSVAKDSGSFVCPAQTGAKLQGTCVNGVININTGYGNLNGNLSGTRGNASGTLSVAGLSADASIQFWKISG